MAVHIGLLFALLASHEAMRIEDDSTRLEAEEDQSTEAEEERSTTELDCESKTETGCCKNGDTIQDDPHGYINAKYPSPGGNTLAELCNQQDVCNLMRQLDMDFYQRAVKGELEDFHLGSGHNPPPTVLEVTPTVVANIMGVGPTWKDLCLERSEAFLTGAKDKSNFGFRTGAIYDKQTCADKAGTAKKNVHDIEDGAFPPGCFTVSSKEGKLQGVYLNNKVGFNLPSSSEGKAHSTPDSKLKTWCVMDRSLSPKAANYYSPYKMKSDGGKGFGFDVKESTSCSFGMMADLAHRGLTESACAKILARRQGTKAEFFERKMLMDLISNHWCPDVWNNAGETMCMVDRKAKVVAGSGAAKSSVAGADIKARLALLYPEDSRLQKFALTDATCDKMDTKSLEASIDRNTMDDSKEPKWTFVTKRG